MPESYTKDKTSNNLHEISSNPYYRIVYDIFEKCEYVNKNYGHFPQQNNLYIGKSRILAK